MNVNGLIAIFVGLLFFGIGAWLIYSDYAASQWNVVQGQIMHSNIASDNEYTNHHYQMMYWADIEYNYSIGNTSYVGSCCNMKSSDAGSANQMSGTHPSGSQASILVNPQNSYQSRLKDDVQPFNLLYVLFAGVGALVVVLGIKTFMEW